MNTLRKVFSALWFKFQYDNTLSKICKAISVLIYTFKFQYDNTLSLSLNGNFITYLIFKFQYDNTLSHKILKWYKTNHI